MAESNRFQSQATLSRARAVFPKLELPGDALLWLYFAVLWREFLWWVTANNYAAWTVAVLLAALVLGFYLAAKEHSEETRVGLPFWVVAVLPLVFVYSLRLAFPDVSFDVLNYRLLHAERGLRGFLYLPGEFFPTPAPYNPAPDMVTGIFRHALGYRLGTIANLLAMIWIARIADKLLRPFWRRAWLRATGVLLVVMAEHLLFEINNYMVDLLAVPLLLEATYLTLKLGERKVKQREVLCIALLLGMSVAFKLTNAGIALPIVIVCAYRVLRSNSEQRWPFKELPWTTLLSAVAFCLPLVPFSVYLYRTTGSAVFPVFNGVFKSDYWPHSNTWDPRWGARGFAEKLAWPILVSFKPERLSELAVYSGRISFGFALAVAGLIFIRRDIRLRALCFIVVLSALLWSASTGYIRYAFYVEVLGAIVVLALISRLSAGKLPFRAGRLGAAAVLCAGLIFQACLAGYYVSQTEWGGRPTVFTQPGPYARETRFWFRDRSLTQFLSPADREKFAAVDVWIVSSMKTASIEALLQPNAPMIGVNTGEYFLAPAARAQFDAALARVWGKRIYSLAFAEDLETAKVTLRRHGLAVQESLPVDLPFFAPQARIPIFLIRLEPAATVAKNRDPIPFTPAKWHTRQPSFNSNYSRPATGPFILTRGN